jgi:hypothetical protein
MITGQKIGGVADRDCQQVSADTRQLQVSYEPSHQQQISYNRNQPIAEVKTNQRVEKVARF